MEREWKIDTVLWPLIPRYNLSPGQFSPCQSYSSHLTGRTLNFMPSVAALTNGYTCWAAERRRRRREWLKVHITKRPRWKLTHVLQICCVLLLHSLRYMASMNQYRQMNCAQHSALNTTRECFVYRSCSLLTVLVFLTNLQAKIHCATAFGRASLSTPFYIAALLSASYTTAKLACLPVLTFLLVEVLQMAESLLRPGVWQWPNSWVGCLQGVQES